MTGARHPLLARLILPVCLVTAITASAHGAEALRIRMIRASNEPTETPAVLADVVAMMKNTLAFKTYALDAETHFVLPAKGELKKLRIYEVTCSGPASQLSVKIVRKGQSILSTVATVRPGQPVILGGFPAREGGMRMFVLTVSRGNKSP